MGGIGLSRLLVHHHIRISVIGQNEEITSHFLHSLHNLSYALIHHFNSLDGCRKNTGMSYHIRIGKVCHNSIIFSGTNRLCKLLRYRVTAHLRL